MSYSLPEHHEMPSTDDGGLHASKGNLDHSSSTSRQVLISGDRYNLTQCCNPQLSVWFGDNPLRWT